MTSKLEIRETLPGDTNGIEQLYRDAFPDEDLLPLVRDLLDLGRRIISLAVIRNNSIAGHIILTVCHLEGGTQKVALLGPLAVTPVLQKQGIGSALIQAGFENTKNSQIDHVFVLGDPAYYSRFGFKTEEKVTTPLPIPAKWHEAWQSLKLSDSEATLEGKLTVPEPWCQAALWAS